MIYYKRENIAEVNNGGEGKDKVNICRFIGTHFFKLFQVFLALLGLLFKLLLFSPLLLQFVLQFLVSTVKKIKRPRKQMQQQEKMILGDRRQNVESTQSRMISYRIIIFFSCASACR